MTPVVFLVWLYPEDSDYAPYVIGVCATRDRAKKLVEDEFPKFALAWNNYTDGEGSIHSEVTLAEATVVISGEELLS